MKPLSGVRVVDASLYVTGPWATMMLADLGAAVIKVEPPGGDPNRRIGRRVGGTGTLFANINRGKRSVVVDLKDGDGRRHLRDLVAGADVFVQNWRPGVAERMGAGFDDLRRVHPGLLYVSITGWGSTGPLRSRPAFDALVQAMSGLAWHGQVDGRPQLLRAYQADKLTSVFTAQAILAALIQAGRSPGARHIEVNMLDAVAYFNFPDLFEDRTLVGDDAPLDPEQAPSTKALVRTADGYLAVSPASGAQIQALCRALDHPEWIDELKQLRSFRELGPELMTRVQEVVGHEPTEHWLRLLADHDVPAAPVLDFDQLLRHPQVHNNRTFETAEHPGFGVHRFARYPATCADPAGGWDGAAVSFPDLDEHREEVRSSRAAGDRSSQATTPAR